MKDKRQFSAIGIMSGTSLDGLDLAYCTFELNEPKNFSIVQAATIPYTKKWTELLKIAERTDALHLAKLHSEYASTVADEVKNFIASHQLPPPEILAFHGHTLFHRPDLGFTFQLGSGAVLAAQSGIDTVCDFRSANVAMGGQGAPLVPIGDAHLFGQYDACLNLGGFGNISFSKEDKIHAYDICPVNMPLNEWARKKGLEYDRNGELAAGGRVHQTTLDALNKLSFYNQPPPKSLGREWYEECFQPILSAASLGVQDSLATICAHVGIQVAKSVNDQNVESILATGGGAHNQFLVETIQAQCRAKIIVPDKDVTDFKEALVFAYLGLLRIQQKPNCLSSYSGSNRDHCAGSLHSGL